MSSDNPNVKIWEDIYAEGRNLWYRTKWRSGSFTSCAARARSRASSSIMAVDRATISSSWCVWACR